MYIKLKYALDIILYYLHIKQNHPNKDSQTPYGLYIPLTIEGWQKLNRLREKSGVKDNKELLAHSLSLFEMEIDHELRGGTIKLFEPNEVNSEDLDLLDQINGKVDWWQDE
jgi:hypothetical protein